MRDLFLTVLNMSLTASYIILVVLLARLILRKAPKVFSYALWAVVLLRLLCPFIIPSPVSAVPSSQPIPPEMVDSPKFYIDSGVPAIDEPVNDYLGDHYFEGVARASAGFKADFLSAAGVVWAAGAVLLLGYSVVSMLRLRRRLMGWIPLEEEKNVRLADHIPSPFVLGVIRPRIYLPSGLRSGEREYILLHERTHIRRGDHIFRALAWLALAVHWFNPLVWLAFHLAGKDMEMSCDEAVLRKMGRDVRADYSESLLRLSTGKRLPAGPLAFGDGNPKHRIKNVLNYRQPALWVVMAALIAVLCAGAALATDRIHGLHSDSPEPPPFEYHEPGPAERWVDMSDYSPDGPWPDSMELQMPEYPGVTFRWTEEMVTAVIEDGESPLPEGLPVTEDGQSILFAGETIWSVYLCDLNGDGLRDMCFTADFSQRRSGQRILGCWYGYNTFSVYGDSAYSCFLRLEGEWLMMEERDFVSGASTRYGRLALTEDGLDIQDTSGGAGLPGAGLTFTPDTTGEEFGLWMEGSVGNVAVQEVLWSPPHLFPEYPCGWLSMAYPAFAGGANVQIHAGWTDESRTSVMISTRMEAALSSQFNVGYWEFTVDLDSGDVTGMEEKSFKEGLPDGETRFYPASISEEEAVRAARIAAKLLTAAEEYYHGEWLAALAANRRAN